MKLLAPLTGTLLFMGAAGSAPGQTAAIAQFSHSASEKPPPPWQAVSLSNEVSGKAHRLIEIDGERLLEIHADNSASALAHPLTHDRYSNLRWRWRVTRPIRGLDPRSREGDDYAARVYVLFDASVGTLGFFGRLQQRVSGWFSDLPVPATALCYVWAADADDGQRQGYGYRSPYSDRVQLIPVTRGAPPADGELISVRRSFVADHEQAFGAPPGPLMGIVLATDTDNSGGTVTAWFSDVELLP